MSQLSNNSHSHFKDLLTSGSIGDAKILLRSLIHAQENSLEDSNIQTNLSPDIDTYDLHDELNPNGISLDLFFEDYSSNEDTLIQVSNRLGINGQDDIRLLLDLSNKRINISQFFDQQANSIQLNFGFNSDFEGAPDRSQYTLGFPNVMFPSDLIGTLLRSDLDELKQLVYDYTSRSWGHSFPDFDVLCKKLTEYKQNISSLEFANKNSLINSCNKSKYYVRLGPPSLFDAVLSAFFLSRQSTTCLQPYSFSPIQILNAIAQTTVDSDMQGIEKLSTVHKLLDSADPQQISYLISKTHFADLFEDDYTILDLSPFVLDFVETYLSLGSTYTFIVPPLTLYKRSSAFWACGTYLQHYPLPFLGEDEALQDVLISWDQFSRAFNGQSHSNKIVIPDSLVNLSASNAFLKLQDIFNFNDIPISRTLYFDHAWMYFQKAMFI